MENSINYWDPKGFLECCGISYDDIKTDGKEKYKKFFCTTLWELFPVRYKDKNQDPYKEIRRFMDVEKGKTSSLYEKDALSIIEALKEELLDELVQKIIDYKAEQKSRLKTDIDNFTSEHIRQAIVENNFVLPDGVNELLKDDQKIIQVLGDEYVIMVLLLLSFLQNFYDKQFKNFGTIREKVQEYFKNKFDEQPGLYYIDTPDKEESNTTISVKRGREKKQKNRYKLHEYLNLWSIAAMLYGDSMGGKAGVKLIEQGSDIDTSRSFINRHFGIDLDINDYTDEDCSESMIWSANTQNFTAIRKRIMEEGLDDTFVNNMIEKNRGILYKCEYDQADFRNRLLAFFSETSDQKDYISCDDQTHRLRLNEIDMFGNRVSHELISILKQRCRSVWNGSEDAIKDDAETLTWLMLLAILGEKVSEVRGYMPFKRHKFQTIYLNTTAEEYKRRFCEANMFLNNTWNQELKLQEIYQQPVFTVDTHKNNSDTRNRNINFFLARRLNNAAATAEESKKQKLKKTVVSTVLGKPGTGKTSLAQYIVSDPGMKKIITRNGFERIHINKFSDLKISEKLWNLDGNQMVPELMKACGFQAESVLQLFTELSGIVLVLDGFDEIELEPGCTRETVLRKIYQFFNVSHSDLLNHFYLMITCRDEYVPDIDGNSANGSSIVRQEKINYIVIQPMERNQIVNFCNQYNELMCSNDQRLYTYNLDRDELYEAGEGRNTKIAEVLGIPMILYMVVAKNIPIVGDGNNTSVAKIYDEIFKASGGIFDPSDYRKDTDPQEESMDEDRLKQLHINEKLLLISKMIALQMFQYSPNKTDCKEEALNRIVRAVYDHDSSLHEIITFEELIKRVKGDNYIRSAIPYTEGARKITFVHRSIYEYFTAAYMFDQVKILSEKIEDAAINTKGKSAEQIEAEKEDVFMKEITAVKPGDSNFKKAFFSLRIILQTRQPSIDIWRYFWQKVDSFVEKNPPMLVRMSNRMGMLFNECLKKENKFLYSDRKWICGNMELSGEDCLAVDPLVDNTAVCMRHELIGFLNFLRIVKGLKLTVMRKQAESSTDTDILYSADKNTNFYSYVRQAVLDFGEGREDSGKGGSGGEDESPQAAQITTLNLSRISMPDIRLSRLDFDHVSLEHSILSGADLRYSSFAGATITGADFSNSNMVHSVLRRAVTESEDSNHKIDFHGADIRNADFQSCKLKSADFNGCHLEDTNMYRTDLKGAAFSGAWLNGTDLCYSDLTGATFHNAHLIHVTLEGADLSSAEFCDAEGKNGADLTGSEFSGAVITKETMFDTDGKEAVLWGDGNLSD